MHAVQQLAATAPKPAVEEKKEKAQGKAAKRASQRLKVGAALVPVSAALVTAHPPLYNCAQREQRSAGQGRSAEQVTAPAHCVPSPTVHDAVLWNATYKRLSHAFAPCTPMSCHFMFHLTHSEGQQGN